ncbi:MAG: alpha/beta hydrolase family protein [Rhizomicrobium sp.]
MLRWIMLFALGGALVSGGTVAEPARGAPPAEAFGNLPAAESAQLSPDGKHLAIIRPLDGREKVVFIDLSKRNAAPYIVGMEGGLADQVYWKSNDRAICVFHATLGYKFQRGFSAWSRAISVRLASQTAVLLMNNAPYFRRNFDAGGIVDFSADDPNHVYMTEVDRWDREFTLDLYQVDLTTGAAQLVMRGNRDTDRYIMDGHGHIVARIDQTADLTEHVFAGSNEIYKYSVKGGSPFAIAGLTAGSDPEFIAERATDHNTTGLYTWSPYASGKALFENPTYDLDDVILDSRTAQIIGFTYVDDKRQSTYFDPAMQRVQKSLEAAYPGQSVSILSKDDSGSAYVALTEGPKNPPVLSLFTPANHQSNIIETAYPLLKPSDLGDVRSYTYLARDGLAIHAYLTLPPGREPRNLPTVIFPHGGPETRDLMEFDWLAQFMASRGYAVLQPNFRGSSGYGRNFVRAGDGEWAGKVQSDVQDGVRKLIVDGIADPKRICIFGASYGGYMALAGATFSPDLYACAVSYAGPSDLNRLLYNGTTFESEAVSIWKRRIGADIDSRKLDSQSPANFADKVKIPILLVHSERDVTVPIEQSEIEEKALRRAGKQVEFVRLAGDDHYLEFADTRIELLKKLETFLAAHIGGAGQIAAK